MNPIFKDKDFRIIMEFCMDIASTISQKSRDDLGYKYYGIVELGRIAHFLRALMRKETDNKIDMEIFNRLATTFNIYQTMTILPSDSEEDIPLLIIQEDNMVINLDSYDKLIQYFRLKWNEFDKNGFIRENQKLLISILYSILTIPRNFDFLKKKYKNDSLLKEIINDCESLALLIQHESGYYYSPRVFKNLDEDTLNILTQYDMTTNQVINEIEKIHNCDTYPIDNLDDRIKNATLEGAFKGILLPVTVDLPDGHKKSFVFANPKDLEGGDLCYETAAYFRYNEIYTISKHGKLYSPNIFLDRLLKRGIAGDATNIGKYYFPLEVKGVIKVIKGSTSNRRRMSVLKPEILTQAKKLLKNDFNAEFKTEPSPPSWLSEPAKFRARIMDSEKIKNQFFDLKKFMRDRW